MEHIGLKVEDHIAIVTINRPPSNALTLRMFKDLADTFHSIHEMETVRVAILRAEGKHFSTGGDVSEFIDITTFEAAVHYVEIVSDCICSVYDCRVPVIGAVNGAALGGGLALASCCDILVAAENGMFGLPEITVSVVGAACFLARMLPQHLTRYMSFTGEMVTAEQMRHFGAVLKVVPLEQLRETAWEIAERLTKQPPLALSRFKAAVNRTENAGLKDKYLGEIQCGKDLIDTDDRREAIRAFLEMRKPTYRGK
jgi:enoyl-CoA hydratase